jgi:hypothetical protein
MTFYAQTKRACPYNTHGKHPQGCDGQVTLTWQPSGASDDCASLEPLVRVLNLGIGRAGSEGIPLSVGPGTGALQLSLTLDGDRVAKETVTADPAEPTRLRRRPSSRARRKLGRARPAKAKLRVRWPGRKKAELHRLELD